MTTAIDGNQIRKVLFEVIDVKAKQGPNYLQQVIILREASQRLGIKGQPMLEQALLTFWYDLFRIGHLSWGSNLSNPNPPFCHLTEQGRRTLENLSRDPANPDGYLGYLSGISVLNPISQSYVEEGLKTYNSGCFKAAAVMIGAAAEALALEVRDDLAERIQELGCEVPRNLNDWRIKRVLEAIKKELESHKRDMPVKLAESFEAYWPAFTQQIRAARNEAGHPSNIEPVTSDTVHASLLIFPELAKLALELESWIALDFS